jgi:hypothetical protein
VAQINAVVASAAAQDAIRRQQDLRKRAPTAVNPLL